MADGAFLRSIGRIYKEQRYTSNGCLIANELSELVEAPGMVITSLRLLNRCPDPDPLKVFERDQGEGVFSLHDQSFGDSVIRISGKPGHSSRQLPEMSFGALGSTPLKPAFKRIGFLSGLSNLLAGMYLTITIYSQILDSEIYSKNIHRRIRRLFWNLNHDSQVEHVLNQHEICLASDPIHPSSLVVSDSDRNKLSALKGNQRDKLLSLPGENAFIINNSATKPKLWFNGFVSLVSFCNLGNGSDCELRREAISLSDRVVDRLMDFNPVGLMHSKSSSSDVIASFIEAMHRILEQLMLLRCGI